MKKTVLTLGLLTLGLLATDFSSMTTEELIGLRGSVALDEQSDYRTEMLSRIDTMSSEELTTLRASRQINSQGLGIGDQGRNSLNQPKLADLDSNSDGRVSEAEFETARADRLAENSADGRLLANSDNAPDFATLDTNSDGFIDTTELQTHQIAQLESRVNQMAQQQGQGRGAGQGMGEHLRDGSGAGSMGQGRGASNRQGGQGMGRSR